MRENKQFVAYLLISEWKKTLEAGFRDKNINKTVNDVILEMKQYIQHLEIEGLTGDEFDKRGS